MLFSRGRFPCLNCGSKAISIDAAAQLHSSSRRSFEPLNVVKVADPAQVREPSDRWTVTDASELYDVASWGKGYFSIGQNGNVFVHPTKEPERKIDLKQLVDSLEWRGISLPILIRFGEILKHRLGELHQAFDTSIREHGYQGSYCCVYPIKVNQQRQVVEEILQY